MCSFPFSGRVHILCRDRSRQSVLQAEEMFEISDMLAVEKNFLQALSPKVCSQKVRLMSSSL